MAGEDDTYDFIVTGAGSAGCAVAGRLSEDGRYRVLLLEAGTRDTNPWIHIPLGYTRTYTDPRVNWMFDSEPEKELNGRTLYQPRGKVLGGTSSINGMVYMRGTPADYDGWRQRGCEGWGYDDVLPYFKKAENQERGADEFHGVGGPLNVSNPVRCPLGDAMVQAAIEAGIPANDDFNGARQEGVGYYQTTTSNRRRWSSARAYLGAAKGRRNLVVATEAHATRILFDGTRAVGVEYRTPHGTKTARARGEIVVSGGVYGSPQLLQLSGLGPGALLRAEGDAQRPRRQRVDEIGLGGAVRPDPLGPPVECRDLCRRLRQERPAPRTARPADQHVRLERLRAAEDRDQAAPVLGLHLEPGASAAGRPRHGDDQEPRPAGAAGDPLQLPGQRVRFPGADLRHPAVPHDRRPAGAETLCRRGSDPRPAMPERRRHPRRDSRARRLQPAPGRHLPHGPRGRFRGRSAPQGARDRAPARRRRLDHAAGAGRQHQRAVDHDRREMRRDGAGGRAGGLSPGGKPRYRRRRAG